MTAYDMPSPNAVGFIHIGKLCIVVVKGYLDTYSSKKVDYIPAQALVQWAEQDWTRAQANLQHEHDRCLYGSRKYLLPNMNGITVEQAPQWFIRLDRSQRYLAQLCVDHLAADNVEAHRAPRLVQQQDDWDQALMQYQHQSRALAWWRRCGLDEITEPGISERRRRPQSKPTMIQELEMIHQMSGHHTAHNPHKHPACPCSRQGNHTHGHF